MKYANGTTIAEETKTLSTVVEKIGKENLKTILEIIVLENVEETAEKIASFVVESIEGKNIDIFVEMMNLATEKLKEKQNEDYMEEFACLADKRIKNTVSGLKKARESMKRAFEQMGDDDEKDMY